MVALPSLETSEASGLQSLLVDGRDDRRCFRRLRFRFVVFLVRMCCLFVRILLNLPDAPRLKPLGGTPVRLHLRHLSPLSVGFDCGLGFGLRPAASVARFRSPDSRDSLDGLAGVRGLRLRLPRLASPRATSFFASATPSRSGTMIIERKRPSMRGGFSTFAMAPSSFWTFRSAGPCPDCGAPSRDRGTSP